MKKIFKIFSLLAVVVLNSCQEDNPSFGDIIAPTNITVTSEVVGQDASNPYGDGSGVVNFNATASNAITYKFVYNGIEKVAPSGSTTFTFSNLGVNTYEVTVLAYGTGGSSSSTTTTVEVLATYAPPADLIDKLVGDGSRTWRIKSEQQNHFGLGPVGGVVPCEWYGAGPEEKAGTGMYDDRYVFNADGTFTHITDNTNDAGGDNPDGTVFGRENLIDELNGPGTGEQNGADILNYPYSDYSENWSIIAPGGVETITLTGIGFIGYYTGGNHQYQIFDRSVPNELVIKTTDGNGEFDWWFVITSEEPAQSGFGNLVWSDEFDTDGAPDSSKWTYDLGAGGWGNNEAQTYTDNAENAIVQGGSLIITAKDDGSGGYTSARLKTQGLYDFTYGKVEVRAKLPSSQGTWPAIWLLGSNFTDVGWPNCGEIDIMEQTGDNKNDVLATCHWFDGSANASYGESTAVSNASSEFHVYSLEWTDASVKMFVDDTLYYTLTNDAALPFNSNFFMVLNVAMGGTLGGTIDPGFTQDTMEVDYVRVYQ